MSAITRARYHHVLEKVVLDEQLVLNDGVLNLVGLALAVGRIVEDGGGVGDIVLLHHHLRA